MSYLTIFSHNSNKNIIVKEIMITTFTRVLFVLLVYITGVLEQGARVYGLDRTLAISLYSALEVWGCFWRIIYKHFKFHAGKPEDLKKKNYLILIPVSHKWKPIIGVLLGISSDSLKIIDENCHGISPCLYWKYSLNGWSRLIQHLHGTISCLCSRKYALTPK